MLSQAAWPCMVRGRVSRVKTVLAACSIGVLLLLWPLDAQARALRAVVRVAEPEDRGLLARVRGQTSDLDVRLLAVEEAPLDAGFDAQLATARTLAEAQDATLVIWFARRAARLVVYVADLDADRVLARGIEQGTGQYDASAQGEAAALVVRSAVRASLAGAALDTPPAERVAVAAPSPSASTMQAPPAPEPSPPPAPVEPQPTSAPRARGPRTRAADRRDAPRVRRVVPWLALGAEAGRDGFARIARGALTARLGLQAGRVELGLGGALGLPARRAVPVGAITLARHRAAVFVGLALLTRPTLRVSAELEAGAEFDVLRIDAAIPSFRASASRSVLALLGANLSAAYAPRWTRGRVALVPSLGVVALPARPVLGYRDGAQFVRVRRLHVVEPTARLLIAAYF